MIEVLEETLFVLSRVPGLGFLETYVMQIREKKGRIEQTVGDYEAKKQNAIGGAKALKDLPRNAKGSKKKR